MDAVRALGLTQGPVHAEFRINERGSVAAGGCAAAHWRALRARPAIPARRTDGEPIGLEELLLRHAVDLPGTDWPRESGASGVMMIPVPRSGILEKVDGDDQARAIPGISELEITARLHDYVAAWPEGSSYLGFCFRGRNTGRSREMLCEPPMRNCDLHGAATRGGAPRDPRHGHRARIVADHSEFRRVQRSENVSAN